jgi:hypothetical protein
VLEDLKMPEDAKTKNIPAPSSKLLRRHSNSQNFDGSFNYCSVVGKLNYLEKGSKPDIAYAVQDSRLTQNMNTVEQFDGWRGI